MDRYDGTRNPLDEEIAVRLLGFRWVVWKCSGAFPLPQGEEGRFLAPPDASLCGQQIAAGLEVPLADDPDQYVPMFSTDLKVASHLARRVGLYLFKNAFLTVSARGEWIVDDGLGNVLGIGPSPPEAVCRAALQWHELHGEDVNPATAE